MNRILSKSFLTPLKQQSSLFHKQSTPKLQSFSRFYHHPIQAKTAYVFKNGFGLVTSEVTLPKGKTLIDVTSPKHAVHGSLWVASDSDVEIRSVQTTKHHAEEDVICSNFTQLLKANINSVFEVQTGSEWTTGRVDSLLLDTDDLKTQQGLLLLHNEKGNIAIPLSRITAVRMPFHPSPDLRGGDADTEVDQRLQTILDKVVDVDSLEISYKNNKEGDATAKLSYITSGLTWIPSYRLNIDNSNSTTGVSRLSMKSLVMNDSDDIFIEDLVFVNGVPTMKFTDVTDPLVSKKTIQEFYKELESTGTSPSSKTIENLPLTITSPAASYRVQQVSLKKADRVSIPVFSVEVPHTVTYQCEMGDGYATNQLTTSPPVYYSVRIENKSQYAWANGSVFINIVGDDTPGGQKSFNAHNVLPATPIGGKVYIDLAPVSGVKVSSTSSTAGTETTETIRIENQKPEAITFHLRRKVSGKSLSIENGGALQTDFVSWELRIGANETAQVSHKFQK